MKYIVWFVLFLNFISTGYTHKFFNDGLKKPIDVRVQFGALGKGGYWKQVLKIEKDKKGEVKGNANDCIIHIEVRFNGETEWTRFKNLKTTGSDPRYYINRCDDNIFRIEKDKNAKWILKRMNIIFGKHWAKVSDPS